MKIPRSSFFRHMKNAKIKMKLICQEDNRSTMWSSVSKRKMYRKISDEVIGGIRKWILNHLHVVISLISNDTLMIKDDDTGRMVTVAKILLEISVRELNNDLISPPSEGAYEGEINSEGFFKSVITMLRSLLPPQLRKMTEKHKQMCGCEKYIGPSRIHSSLNAWRTMHLKKMTTDAKQIHKGTREHVLETKKTEMYKSYIYSDTQRKIPLHPKPPKAILCMQCDPVEGGEFPKFHIYRICNDCPKFNIVEEESKQMI